MSIVIMTLQAQADGEDDPTILEIDPRTILSWEKNNTRRSMTMLSDDAVKLEYLYEIAWIALNRPGDDFGDFCAKTAVAYGQVKKPDSADVEHEVPTSVAASTGSSLS